MNANIVPRENRWASSHQHRKADLGQQIIELRVGAEKRTDQALALTESERGEFEECEGIIETGLSTFYEVGTALLKIRESRLYRSTHSTFEQYCQDRWNIGRSYACRVIGAAERLNLLPGDDTVLRPANEFQMRPFLKLAPEEFPGAWKRAVKSAKEGKVTTSVIQAVIHELLPDSRDQVRTGRKGKRTTAKAKLPTGQLLVLLNEAKRHVQKGETDETLAALNRIENLLFSA